MWAMLVVTNVLTRLEKEKISVEDLFSMLLSHEIDLRWVKERLNLK